MGYWKEYAETISARGYEDSDKHICAGCAGDKYFYKLIRATGTKSTCSFCGKQRKVLPVNSILEVISEIIKRDYLPAEGNAIYDSEDKQYLEPVIDPYNFVFEELNEYLESDCEEFLQELFDKLALEDRMSADVFRLRQDEIDMQGWQEYCNLVKNTPFSAEQIVSLIKPENKKKITEDLEAIQGVLEMVYDYCDEFKVVKTINGMSGKKKMPIYRCVNYLELNSGLAGLNFIPATLVGTAPAKVVADGRMSEKGDMMFYGAEDKKTAMIEVGRDLDHPDYPATIGAFYTNKQFRILDLSDLSLEDLPSIFDIKNEQKRSAWFFLREFMTEISKSKDDRDKEFYKPTQVFTKYIQRNTDLKGIKFKSSKADGNCYVLFVVNRDCLDKGDKVDNGRNQLIMDRVDQIDFSVAGLSIAPPSQYHFDENGNGIYDLTADEKECVSEHKKFYADFFGFGHRLLNSFKDPIKDYELTIFSTYYRILELLDTLEVMTIESLINSGFLVVRSLLEAVGMLCYVLCDDKEIEKRAIIWQMMDIKRTACDETLYYQHMQAKDCYKEYVPLIKDSKKIFDNWYSYCEGTRTSISELFTIAGLEDVYETLYRPLCFENHEVNHMESNIECNDGRFCFKLFRKFENHILLLNSVIRAMIPINNLMVEKYGDLALQKEWNEYEDKASKYIEFNNKVTTDMEKQLNPLVKWF